MSLPPGALLVAGALGVATYLSQGAPVGGPASFDVRSWEDRDEFPAEVQDVLSDPGPGAVAWQRCWIATNDDGEVRVDAAAGVYDPERNMGAEVVENGRSDGTSYPSRSHVDPTNGVHGNDVSIDLLRTVGGITSLFDFETVAVDALDDTNSLPLVQAIDPASVEDGAAGPTGGAFTRFEGIPAGWPALSAEDDPSGYSALAAMSNAGPDRTTGGLGVWALDIWSTDGRVERTRVQRAATGTSVQELRFVEPSTVIRDDALVPPACPSSLDDEVDGWFWTTAWEPTRRVPPKISLDPKGVPYETELHEGTTVRRESVGQLVAPAGEVRVLDGISANLGPGIDAQETVPVRVAGVENDEPDQLDVDVLWTDHENEQGDQWSNTLGVWLGASDAEVAAWDDFEPAYGTDGGIGAVLTEVAFVGQKNRDDHDGWLGEDEWPVETFAFHDVDGAPGDDLFVFRNGWGDGGFPLSRGRNAAGDVVAVLIWRIEVPWRVAVPEGEPPDSVLVREAEMAECVAGTRAIDATGWCPTGPQN